MSTQERGDVARPGESAPNAKPLFESMKYFKHRFEHLEYHRERMDRSRKSLLGLSDSLDLHAIVPPAGLSEGLYKCRVVYGTRIDSVEFSRYVPRPLRRLALVNDDRISYEHKFVDRAQLNALAASHPEADDVIVVRRGLLADARYANIALFDGRRWSTPAQPLLRGTCRERLLREGVLVEADIRPEDLRNYRHISLINAMLELEEIVLPISQLVP